MLTPEEKTLIRKVVSSCVNKLKDDDSICISWDKRLEKS